jgi:hypothetical protein
MRYEVTLRSANGINRRVIVKADDMREKDSAIEFSNDGEDLKEKDREFVAWFPFTDVVSVIAESVSEEVKRLQGNQRKK